MINVMKSIEKILIVLIIIQIIFASINISLADKEERIGIEDIINRADSFISEGKEESDKGEIVVSTGEEGNATIKLPSVKNVQNTINDIYNIIFPLAVAITVIVGGILGIKFMLASAEDKAKIKESLIPYVAGCIAIYGAFGIWKIVILLLSAIN